MKLELSKLELLKRPRLPMMTPMVKRLWGMLGFLVMLAIGGFLAAPSCCADVILLTNRSPDSINLVVSKQGGGYHKMKIYPQDILPLIVQGPVELAFDTGAGMKDYDLKPNTIYFFGRIQGARENGPQVDMQELGLTMPSTRRNGRPLGAENRKPVPGVNVEKTEKVGTITVKIMVDEGEASLRSVWEKRLRERMEAASKILEQTCRLRLEVIGTGRWKSENAGNFDAALKEFEEEVAPEKADLVIGFTSKYVSRVGRIKLGGTYGLFRRHILIREHLRKTSEAERLEVLLHEIGHTLGCTHSPEEVSVMRPKLADDRANSAGFRIAFDPINALAMNLVSEGWRYNDARTVKQLPISNRIGLMNVYSLLRQAMPKDSSTVNYLRTVATSYPKPGPKLPKIITDLPPE